MASRPRAATPLPSDDVRHAVNSERSRQAARTRARRRLERALEHCEQIRASMVAPAPEIPAWSRLARRLLGIGGRGLR